MVFSGAIKQMTSSFLQSAGLKNLQVMFIAAFRIVVSFVISAFIVVFATVFSTLLDEDICVLS